MINTDILGMGLLFSEGAEHKRQKRILMGLFSVPNLKKIFPVFREEAEGFTRWLDEGMGEDGRRVVDGELMIQTRYFSMVSAVSC